MRSCNRKNIQEAKMEQLVKIVAIGKTGGSSSKKRRWESSFGNRLVKAIECKKCGRWHRGQCRVA